MWKATCDRLCRADDAVSRSIRLQIFASMRPAERPHARSRGIGSRGCLSKPNTSRVSWCWGRTTPLRQLVRRISGRKRMGPRLVAAFKDEEGKVISTREAAAAMWERSFLRPSRNGRAQRCYDAVGRGPGRESHWASQKRGEISGPGAWSGSRFFQMRPRCRERLLALMRFLRRFLRAGGISLLPHLARLAARPWQLESRRAGVEDGWLLSRRRRCFHYLAEQPRHYVRQCGGQSCGQGSAFEACWSSGGEAAWGCATMRHRVSIACLQAFPQRSCEDETPCSSAFHGLGQRFLLCSSGAGFGSYFNLPKEGAGL